jgi:regulator of protease activity HflC (stomatin/prohibitin superfamily)
MVNVPVSNPATSANGVSRASPMGRSAETAASTANGLLMILLCLALIVGGGVLVTADSGGAVAAGILAIILGVFGLMGLYMVQPNEGVAILLFGAYRGTDRAQGLRWVLPWYIRKKISLRTRNVTSDQLKVNDKRGNPIEIAANVVWRVTDSAQALFDVQDYAAFVNIQIDTALRDIASHYAYDHGSEAEPTLRSDTELVAGRLREELEHRVRIAGVSVDEARLAHLAYAPEIAGAMLRRQQAEAVLSARAAIVSGAVTMVEAALRQLGERNVVNLDEERKANMVSNLLVVLCADRDAQPVVNAGTLYGG